MSSNDKVDKVLFAIPARGGSKRLLRKNLVNLCEKPMLAYTIEAAFNSELADDVFVCTEDEEIATVAEQYGAKVFAIPESMADDDVSSTVPCLALYDELNKDKLEIDYIFNLQPTSPLRTGDDIRNAFKILSESNADFLISVTSIDPHYFHWAVVEKHEGWEMFFGKEFMKERIMLPPVFRPNGAIKLGRAAKVKDIGHFFGHPLAVYNMPEERSIHIATHFDLTCARAIISGLKGRRDV